MLHRRTSFHFVGYSPRVPARGKVTVNEKYWLCELVTQHSAKRCGEHLVPIHDNASTKTISWPFRAGHEVCMLQSTSWISVCMNKADLASSISHVSVCLCILYTSNIQFWFGFRFRSGEVTPNLGVSSACGGVFAGASTLAGQPLAGSASAATTAGAVGEEERNCCTKEMRALSDRVG